MGESRAGSDGRLFPWGNEWLPDCCNGDRTRITRVDAYSTGASPAGCEDMVGNAREWTTTLAPSVLRRMQALRRRGRMTDAIH